MIDRTLVEKIARLARLALTEEEKVRVAGQLGAILSHFRALDALDVRGIEPSPYAIPIENVLREDEPRAEPAPDVLAHAPDREGRFFRVPAILAEDAGGGAGPAAGGATAPEPRGA